MAKVKVEFGRTAKEYELVERPYPHILVPTTKHVVHGWAYGYYTHSGYRECCSERILLNPYNGCSGNCPYCYTRVYGGYFKLWDEKGVVTVFERFDEKLKEELSQLYGASCGYLSPATDPFQKPLENVYRLSEKSAYALLDLDIPVEFITKFGGNISLKLLDRMGEHPYKHCFCQFSVLTLDDDLRKVLVPGGSSVQEQLKAIRRCVDRGLFTVVRVDPIIPGVNDDLKEIREIVEACKDLGVKHFIFSICDIYGSVFRRMKAVAEKNFPDAIKVWKAVYTEKLDGSMQANTAYRKMVFGALRRICLEEGVTMSLCMEFELVERGGRKWYRGLNEDYALTSNCEGIDIPFYYRKSLKEKFKPLPGCNGNCLACAKRLQVPVCGERKLASASSLKYHDYLKLRPHRAVRLA